MNDTATWLAILGGGGGSIITFITFWMTLTSRITSAEAKAEAAEEYARRAEHLASVAIGKGELIVSDIHAHRERFAAKVASLESVTDSTAKALVHSEQRLVRGMEEISTKIDNLSKSLIETLGDLIVRQAK